MKILNMKLGGFAILWALILSSCEKKSNEERSGNQELTIIGSNTEFELVQALKEELYKTNRTFIVKVEGGGSEDGIKALIERRTDLANSSRELNEDELQKCKTKRVIPVPVIFGVDALAIITNSKLGIDSLSINQIASLFSGEIKNWKELGGPDLPVHLYGRDEHSGTNYFFKQKILHHEYGKGIKTFSKYKKIIEAVKDDIAGVGYVSVGHIMELNGKPSNEIWACYVYIEGSRAISPYEVQSVIDGSYPLIRPLYQYSNGNPTGFAKKFIDFELSEEGQTIVSQHGFFPINDYHKKINSEKVSL
jgi:phosphate transport system substrate-binding protein